VWPKKILLADIVLAKAIAVREHMRLKNRYDQRTIALTGYRYVMRLSRFFGRISSMAADV